MFEQQHRQLQILRESQDLVKKQAEELGENFIKYCTKRKFYIIQKQKNLAGSIDKYSCPVSELLVAKYFKIYSENDWDAIKSRKNSALSVNNKVGATYGNCARILPKGKYLEYDVINEPDSKDRGACRLLRDSETGNVYFTRDHGATFVQLTGEEKGKVYVVGQTNVITIVK